jgi:Arc/MetJ-type ribon-helix-helix transcriptional regulator
VTRHIAPTSQVDRLVDGWIREGSFANRSEAFRAGIFALKDKLATESRGWPGNIGNDDPTRPICRSSQS